MIMEDHNRSDDDEEKRCKTDADPDLTGSDDPLSEDEDIDSMIDDYYDSDAFDFDDPPPKSVREEDHDDLDYRCLPLPEAGNRYLQKGNKIIMPEASLHRLLCSLEVRSDLSMPMLFRVENRSNGKTSNCGVLEFTGSNPKQVFFPNWMMLNMGLNEGDPVTLQSIVLDKATFIKLQPHTTEFLWIQNPKAVLEENLLNFACVTAGDTISISHDGKVFAVDVVEARPHSAVCLIDTDCEVDFLPPLDYKEPLKSSEPVVPVPVPAATAEREFRPFTGSARRLDGQPSRVAAPAPATSLEWKKPCCGLAGAPKQIHEGAQEKPKFQAFTGKKYTLGG